MTTLVEIILSPWFLIPLVLYLCVEIVLYHNFVHRRDRLSKAPPVVRKSNKKFCEDLILLILEASDEDMHNFLFYNFYGKDVTEITAEELKDWFIHMRGEAGQGDGVDEEAFQVFLENAFRGRKWREEKVKGELFKESKKPPPPVNVEGQTTGFRFGMAPMNVMYKPLPFTLAIRAMQLFQYVVMYAVGFRRYPCVLHPERPIKYWVLVPKEIKNPQPLLFLPGFGFALVLYTRLMVKFAYHAITRDRLLIVPEHQWIGLQLWGIPSKTLKALPSMYDVVDEARAFVLFAAQRFGLDALQHRQFLLQRKLSRESMGRTPPSSKYQTQGSTLEPVEEGSEKSHQDEGAGPGGLRHRLTKGATKSLSSPVTKEFVVDGATSSDISSRIPEILSGDMLPLGRGDSADASTSLLPQRQKAATCKASFAGGTGGGLGGETDEEEDEEDEDEEEIYHDDFLQESSSPSSGPMGARNTVAAVPSEGGKPRKRLQVRSMTVQPGRNSVSGRGAQAIREFRKGLLQRDVERTTNRLMAALVQRATTPAHAPHRRTDTGAIAEFMRGWEEEERGDVGGTTKRSKSQPGIRYDVVGHSYGTALGSCFWKRYRHEINTITLMDPVCFIAQLPKIGQLVELMPWNVKFLDMEVPAPPPADAPLFKRVRALAHLWLHRAHELFLLMVYWVALFTDSGTVWTATRQLHPDCFVDTGELFDLEDRLLVVFAKEDLIVAARPGYEHCKRMNESLVKKNKKPCKPLLVDGNHCCYMQPEVFPSLEDHLNKFR
uniref:AB hydrolase-1 domain-containing protein n=1 Tax=Chromera velia CCMP2878 TaxID=1169474 RepID=A0A0G4HF41_9ALVE|eukprot:Cvel_6621.t1-p1 / transcript=Cvel_6621.t1 / gene=Cvel_6621 / organism=Chromera_velia_CCMP2878 / gene_product=hypothetical protein / transcript_product=hypothetical protein / location=Cvel_scaffold328:13952-18379(-) / protein_length=773 / sequence_SO=supercontig / SO=protein_coding / is_pseudo=false